MTSAVPLEAVLALAAALFCIGLFGALSRRSTIAVLMGIELMLNSVNINLIAFWRYLEARSLSVMTGQTFALFIIVVAAAELAVGLAMVISIYRSWQTVNAEQIDSLRG